MEFWLVAAVTFMCICQFHMTESSAVVEIRLESYYNEEGTLDNGDHCDEYLGIVTSPCDYSFLICLDDRQGTYGMDECKYGQKQTGEVEENADIIRQFASTIGKSSNPMTFPFDSWPGSVKIKIIVEDVDIGRQKEWGLVDQFVKVVDMTAARSESSAQEQPFIFFAFRTSLRTKIRVFCESHFFGPSCNVRCNPSDDYENRYTCNKTTGEKILCNSGMACEDDVDKCLSSPCEHYEQCSNTIGGFECTCAEDWTGILCEIKSGSVKVGVYIGVAIGGSVLTVVVVLVVVLRCKRHKKQSRVRNATDVPTLQNTGASTAKRDQKHADDYIASSYGDSSNNYEDARSGYTCISTVRSTEPREIPTTANRIGQHNGVQDNYDDARSGYISTARSTPTIYQGLTDDNMGDREHLYLKMNELPNTARDASVPTQQQTDDDSGGSYSQNIYQELTDDNMVDTSHLYLKMNELPNTARDASVPTQ